MARRTYKGEGMVMKVAILGAGRIAHSMAEALSGIAEAQKYAVAARDLERAETFAKEWGFTKAYGSYEEMLKDPEVELVYVATPHSHHYEHAKLCLEHGKNVLLEKAFTVNAKQAEELITLAREKKKLLAEAIWTRYMPSRKMIDDLLAEEVIGKVTSITANLCYEIQDKERMQEPSLAGGALLDLGVYTINFAKMVVKKDVKEVISHAVMSPKGIDWMDSITLIFEDDTMAVLHSSMLSESNRMGLICGEKGYLEVQNINNCEQIRLYDADHKLCKIYEVPEQINGYEYEVRACIKAIQEGKIECEEMSHEEILWVMRLMDRIRNDWGMVYPFEK